LGTRTRTHAAARAHEQIGLVFVDFYTGLEIGTVTLNTVKSPVTMLHHGTGKETFLLLGTKAGGKPRTYKLSAWIEPIRDSAEREKFWSKTKPLVKCMFHSTLEPVTEPSLGEVAGSADAKALLGDVVVARRAASYTIAYEGGALRTFSRNGTQRFVMSVNSTVTALAQSASQHLYFATKTSFASVRVTRKMMSEDNIVCPTKNFTEYPDDALTVVSIAVDIKRKNLVYIALSTGELVTLNTRFRKSSRFCRPLHTVRVLEREEFGPTPLTAGSVKLVMTKGYLLYGIATPKTGINVIVYNVTDWTDPPVFTMQESFHKEAPPFSEGHVLTMASVSDIRKETFVSVGTGSKLLGMQSLLKFSENNSKGFGFSRVPLFLGGIALVLLYQWWKGRRGNPVDQAYGKAAPMSKGLFGTTNRPFGRRGHRRRKSGGGILRDEDVSGNDISQFVESYHRRKAAGEDVSGMNFPAFARRDGAGMGMPKNLRGEGSRGFRMGPNGFDDAQDLE